jgi:ketosteroid isomerase-like protein
MMRTIPSLLLLLLILLPHACKGPVPDEKMKMELLEADRSFSELSAQKGMKIAFETYCDEEGVLLRSERTPIEGKEEIVALLQMMDDSAFRLTWTPLYARVARSGELGYTYGTYEQLVLENGEIRKGTYVSIWRKGKDGWKFILDTGNEGLGE